eukprot:SAG31_NODE_11286_length_1046_cov_1.178458_2_plen_95_part_00
MHDLRGPRGFPNFEPSLLLLAASLIPTAATKPRTSTVDFDVLVYGSTPAGIAAATAAGQLGMKVAVFEPLPMIGGMVSQQQTASGADQPAALFG